MRRLFYTKFVLFNIKLEEPQQFSTVVLALIMRDILI